MYFIFHKILPLPTAYVFSSNPDLNSQSSPSTVYLVVDTATLNLASLQDTTRCLPSYSDDDWDHFQDRHIVDRGYEFLAFHFKNEYIVVLYKT